MPSHIKAFQFREAKLRAKLEKLKINPDSFAQVLLQHTEESIDEGVCPICGKLFDQCDYFRRLEDD